VEPTVSVVVVSDFASGTEHGWDDLRRALSALARQDFTEPVEFILIESEDLRGQVPPDLEAILPSLRIVYSPGHDSYTLKNDGVCAATTEIVAILDGDCTPDPDWLRHLVGVMREEPNVAAVSGRTIYPPTSLYSRLATLLERAYIEHGGRGKTRHIANNGAGFRRSAYLQNPLPTGIGVFASQLQAEAMQRTGQHLFFEPRMRVIHAFEWSFDREHRTALGYGAIQTRRSDAKMPYAHLARLGYASVAIFALGRFLKASVQAVRYHRLYDVGWYELPAAFVMAGVGCAMEIPGMMRAVRNEPPPVTRFR
jgi:hypothetical protein